MHSRRTFLLGSTGIGGLLIGEQLGPRRTALGAMQSARLTAAIGAPAKVVASTYSASSVDQVLLADATGQAPPTALSVTPRANGGAFAARAAPSGYYWTVTATAASGESVALNTWAAMPIAANGSAVLTWTAAPGATGYNVYRSTFNDPSKPPASTPTLVASVGNVTTCTETGTATGGKTPPSTNGAAFAITLPDATTSQTALTIKAIGNTPNLVALNTLSGQSIDGAGSGAVTLGQVGTASYQAIQLVSDGANWHSAQTTPAPRIVVHGAQLSASASPNTGSSSGYTPLVIVPLPQMGFGQSIRAHWNLQFIPASLITAAYVFLYYCKSNGTIVGYNSGNGGLNGTQLAYWEITNITAGTFNEFSGDWLYLPRPGDFSIESNQGTYNNLGLFINPIGGSGSSTIASAYLSAEVGGIAASYTGTY